MHPLSAHRTSLGHTVPVFCAFTGIDEQVYYSLLLGKQASTKTKHKIMRAHQLSSVQLSTLLPQIKPTQDHPLKMIRVRQGFSALHVADRVGIAITTYYRAEKGTEVTRLVQEYILIFYGIPFKYIEEIFPQTTKGER
jgi:DNA-binding XRE family transcriptional regulator